MKILKKNMNTNGTMTIMLKFGFILPTDYFPGDTYPEESLIFHDEFVMVANKDTKKAPKLDSPDWNYFCLKTAWRGQWSSYNSYVKGDYVHDYYHIYKCGGDIICGGSSEKGRLSESRLSESRLSEDGKDKSIEYVTLSSPLWKIIGDIGSRFPGWSEDLRSLNVTVDISKSAEVHPASGGIYWELADEQMLGAEYKKVSDQHISVRNMYKNQSHIIQIYTVRIIHCGSYQRDEIDIGCSYGSSGGNGSNCSCGSNCSGVSSESSNCSDVNLEQKFIGITLGTYMLPPGDAGIVVSKNLGLGKIYNRCDRDDDEPPLIAYKSKESGKESKDNIDINTNYNLLPIINKVNGEKLTTVYLQWNSHEVPYIIQSESNYCLYNRPPPVYLQMMKKCSDNANRCNLFDNSLERFREHYIERVTDKAAFVELINTGKLDALVYHEFDKWNRKICRERYTYFDNSKTEWVKGNNDWIISLDALKKKIIKMLTRLDKRVSNFNFDMWFNNQVRAYTKCRIKSKSAKSIKTNLEGLLNITELAIAKDAIAVWMIEDVKKEMTIISSILS